MAESIETVIERSLEGDSGLIEREVFGSADARAIGAVIARFCAAELGAAPAAGLFYQASVGCVLGLELDDGRRVVLKAHQPDKSVARLAACQAVQAGLCARGFPCPEPLLGPRPLGRGLAVVERHVATGAPADPHDPAIRAEIAARLHELMVIARAADLGTGLHGSWFGSLPAEQLWPRPHNPRIDFPGTARGAEWIDALARRARSVPLAGARVLGHFDWRSEHFRFEAGRMSVVYDWDSLHFEREPIAAGAAAYGFSADFSRPDVALTPSLEEIFGFFASYEHARGRAFDTAERRSAHASAVYSLAYVARCQHAEAAERTGARQLAFIDLLREAGPALLASA
jgi:hypothetical protein